MATTSKKTDAQHKFKVTYFPSKGRAEIPRLMFHYAGVEFDDVHVPMEEWKKIKNDTSRFPQHQMPTLEVDGKLICQSDAINRCVAFMLGLYGDTGLDVADIEQVVSTVHETVYEVVPAIFKTTNDMTKRQEVLKEIFQSEKVELRLNFLEKMLTDNKSKKGYFVGDQVTFADIYTFASHEFLTDYYPEALDCFEKLKEHRQTLLKNENIAKYIANRPEMKWLSIEL